MAKEQPKRDEPKKLTNKDAARRGAGPTVKKSINDKNPPKK